MCLHYNLNFFDCEIRGAIYISTALVAAIVTITLRVNLREPSTMTVMGEPFVGSGSGIEEVKLLLQYYPLYLLCLHRKNMLKVSKASY